MKLKIVNMSFPHASETIENPQFIPRMGERIETDYNPAPTVTSVVHCYHSDTVIVTVE
jgi:hypothetical protein